MNMQATSTRVRFLSLAAVLVFGSAATLGSLGFGGPRVGGAVAHAQATKQAKPAKRPVPVRDAGVRVPAPTTRPDAAVSAPSRDAGAARDSAARDSGAVAIPTRDVPRDPRADAVVARVQRFYDENPHFAATFEQTYFNKLYNTTTRSRGRVVFKRPGKMRFDYAEPARKVYVSDGSRLIAFEPGETNNDPGQFFEQNLADAQLPSAMAFLTGTRRLADEFDARLLDAAREGFPGGFVLELRPKRVTTHYDRILFYVNDVATAPGANPTPVIRRFLILDHSGNRNRFDFSAFDFHPTSPDSTFTWRPPSGARRITP